MNMQIKKLFLLPTLIGGILSFVFTACQNTGKNEQQQTTASTPKVETQQLKTFENVSFINEDGADISLGSLEGKVVFINFWATWCPPCKKELPSIQTLKKSFKENDNIVFLMVDIDGTMKKSVDYMKDNQLDLPVYIPKDRIPTEFLGNAVPTTVILNKNGEIAARTVGAGDYSKPEVKKAIDDLIAQ